MPASAKQTYFNGLAAAWDTLPGPEDGPAKVRRFVEQAGVPAPGWILDAGCGTGILLPALVRRYPQTGILEADFAEDMLKENARKLPHSRVSRVCADARRLPVRPESLDLVLCFGLLPHLEDIDAALGEFLCVLRPGGSLAIGHFMGSRELNAFHGSLEGPISKDHLPPARELAGRLSRLGAVFVQAEEEPAWYFVRAQRATS
jgi:ubiquinone/menaquinone biosynthesis C-methylase UbiE